MDPQNKTLIHSIDSSQRSSAGFSMGGIIILIVAILAGVGTGYFISSMKKTQTTAEKAGGISNKKVVESSGIADDKTFPDKAEGLLKEGGIEGEGAFHLQRPGGESQNVYLTSTTVDLEPFIGKTIRVMGKTFQGEKAGWLMDVGYVELLQ